MPYILPHLRKAAAEAEEKAKKEKGLMEMTEAAFPTLGNAKVVVAEKTMNFKNKIDELIKWEQLSAAEKARAAEVAEFNRNWVVLKYSDIPMMMEREIKREAERRKREAWGDWAPYPEEETTVFQTEAAPEAESPQKTALHKRLNVLSPTSQQQRLRRPMKPAEDEETAGEKPQLNTVNDDVEIDTDTESV